MTLPLFGAEGVRRFFDIPSGDAGVTLKVLADQSGYGIVVSSELVRGVTTNPVRGEMSVGEAMEAMLRGTGLSGVPETAVVAYTVRKLPVAPPTRGSGSDARKPRVRPEGHDEIIKLDEFLVTGSYLKQTSYADIGSQVSVVTADELTRRGSGSKPSDFMRNLPQAVGLWADGVSGDNQFGSGALDLRGLGTNASLVLLNGYRQTRNGNAAGGDVDINTMPPSIMIARVETLLDGASSLYGADAVGGVANFITRDEFTGTEVRTDYRTITNYRAKYGQQYTGGLMLGAPVGERFHIVAAYEYVHQTALPFGGTGYTAKVQGTPTQFANAITFPGNFQVPVRDASGNLTGARVLRPDPDCLLIQQLNITTNPKTPGWGSDIYMYNGQCYGQYSFYGVLNDQQRWNSRVAVTGKISDRVAATLAFGATSTNTTVAKPPSSAVPGGYTVPGTNPGNPFRAVNSLGQPLYAVPSTTDSKLPLLDASGNAVLTSDPTNPASGVPFNENVLIASWRPLSTTNSPVSLEEFKTTTVRGEAGIEGSLNPNWNWRLHYTYAGSEKLYPTTDVYRDKVLDGINGRLTLDGQSNVWLNPFGSSVLVEPGDPKYNSPELLDSLKYRARSERYTTTLQSWDMLLTGVVGRLPTGPVSAAVGGQVRRETLSQVYDPMRRSGLLLTAPTGSVDFYGASNSFAGFFETAVPILNVGERRLELSTSARYERDEVNDTFNPKLGLVYRHSSRLRFSASYGSSFLAPSLFQRYGERTTPTEVFDPITGRQMFFTGIFGGTPGLRPQKSKAYNLGVSATPTRNLSLSANYWRFDFSGLISTRTTLQTIEGVQDGSVPSSWVVRDPVSQDITLMRLPYYNAQSRHTDGVDLDVRYRSSSPMGEFTFSGSGTVVNSYDLTLTPNSPVRHGVGNMDAGVMPKWKAVGGVSWEQGANSAALTMYYTSKVRIPAAQAALATPGITDPIARDRVTLNLQYQRDFDRFIHGLKVTAGIVNLANKAPNIPAGQFYGFIFGLSDPLPRRAYLTLDWSY